MVYSMVDFSIIGKIAAANINRIIEMTRKQMGMMVCSFRNFIIIVNNIRLIQF